MKLLSKAEAAAWLGVPAATFRNWADSGLIPPDLKGPGDRGRRYWSEATLRAVKDQLTPSPARK
jgi:DNA-binding transcriptional MerR regulator